MIVSSLAISRIAVAVEGYVSNILVSLLHGQSCVATACGNPRPDARVQ